jgi:hypothetical protein
MEKPKAIMSGRARWRKDVEWVVGRKRRGRRSMVGGIGRGRMDSLLRRKDADSIAGCLLLYGYLANNCYT